MFFCIFGEEPDNCVVAPDVVTSIDHGCQCSWRYLYVWLHKIMVQ